LLSSSYFSIGKKALHSPGLREAMLIIGTGIVLFVTWLTMIR